MNRFFHIAISALVVAGCLQSCKKQVEPSSPEEKTVAVTAVKLNNNSLALTAGDQATLVATVSPSDATDKTVKWSSSNEKVAKVDNGKVTAVAAGDADITATAGGKNAVCKVTVVAKVIQVEKVSLDKTSLSLVEGDEATLVATVSPDDATDKTVTWNTSDEKVATVENGKVLAVAEGEAIITATSGKKSATCTVTVSAKVIDVTGIEVDPANLTLKEGEKHTLTVKFIPEDATNKNVTWRSSNTTVATVSEDGEVTALAEGKSKVIATTEDGGHEALCEVTVNVDDALKGISFASSSYEITAGKTMQLEVLFIPSYAANKNVTFTSSDTGVATVNETGLVKGIKAGTTTITAVSEEGGFEASCQMNITERLNPDTFVMTAGNLYLNGELYQSDKDIENFAVDADGAFYVKSAAGNWNHNYYKDDVQFCKREFIYSDNQFAAAADGNFYELASHRYCQNYYLGTAKKDGTSNLILFAENSISSYGMFAYDMDITSEGTALIVGGKEDEYNIWNAILWEVDTNGNIKENKLTEGTKDSWAYAIDIDENGNVYILMTVKESTGNTCYVLKNGEKTDLVYPGVYQQNNSRVHDMSVWNGDIYVFLTEGNDERAVVYKNADKLYTFADSKYGDRASFIKVSSKGDIYTEAGGVIPGIGNASWVRKNDSLLYTIQTDNETTQFDIVE